MCIDFRKLNKATRKEHYPLPFIDQMLKRLPKYSHFFYLDGYSGVKFLCINMIRKRQLSPLPLVPFFFIGECHLVYVKLMPPFKDA
jgi:hypothetical protein